MTAVIEAQSVSMAINGATLVDAIDLRIDGGETVAIVGPNGAGKSTLLRLLSGDLRATRGEVRLKLRELQSYPARQLALHRAMLSQHVSVTFPFTVEEIVHMGAGDSGRATAPRFVDATLHEVGLNDFRQRQLPTLSGGEQQRAHFARVLVQLACGEALHGPGLLLLDEPTSSLDMRHQIDLSQRNSDAGNHRANIRGGGHHSIYRQRDSVPAAANDAAAGDGMATLGLNRCFRIARAGDIGALPGDAVVRGDASRLRLFILISPCRDPVRRPGSLSHEL
ncbi:MAG: ATP-binding cassette domain-containing protein [Xanthobacteraceae bacterium]